jgi:hypothetical protein
MTVFYGAMMDADAKVDALRLPLKTKPSSVSDLPAHIVAFRGVLAQLIIAGQAPITITLDAFRLFLFLATLSPFPVFHQYTLLFTVAHGNCATEVRGLRRVHHSAIPQHSGTL